MDRKEKRPPRITSVVFNQHGTEILTSYSSESLYLLDSKQTISQEQSQERIIEHRNEKQTRTNKQEIKTVASESPTTEEKKPSHFKRLRLRGDWSDTGPDSRPVHEQESELSSPPTTTSTATTTTTTNTTEEQQSTNTNPEEQQPTTRNRNLQNFFMQRMSDILTQLVAGTEPSNEEREATVTANTNEDNNNSTPTVTETNTHTESTSAATPTTNPIVQSPTSNENSASATTESNADDNESETSRDVRFYF
jgi:nuclear receptor interaction protein